MDDFRAALPRLRQLKESRASLHQEQLDDEIKSQLEIEVKKSRLSFRNLILLLLGTVVIAGVLISISAYFYANRVKQTQAEIQTLYQDSISCYQLKKYQCACDGFQRLINAGVELPELAENLNRAQFGLAKQYFASGQWESAVDELKDLLQRDPGNRQAVTLLHDSYDQWINQLGLEGNWLKRWSVRKERDARFPLGGK
jgi:tetratricopeptide (TPR) repeat protein